MCGKVGSESLETPKKAVPILIIGYRRPKETQKVINAISSLSRRNIYFFCDGPTDEREARSQREILRISKQLETGFSLFTNFQSKHLGLREGVLSALDWFFSHETRGVILEDDIVVGPDFIEFCEGGLDFYESDQRVQQVVGSNPFGMKLRISRRHFLSSRMDCWGWATWRDRWLEFRASTAKTDVAVSEFWAPKRMVREIQSGHQAAINGTLESWAYSWAWYALTNAKLSVVASTNLIENIGTGPQATHTRNVRFISAGVMGRPREFPKPETPDYLFVYATEALRHGSLLLAKLRRRFIKSMTWVTRLLSRIQALILLWSSDEREFEAKVRKSR